MRTYVRGHHDSEDKNTRIRQNFILLQQTRP
jgi:hypothetical protein